MAENTIVKEVNEAIEELTKKYKDDPQTEKLKTALEQYNELISKGVIQKRGYNLLTIEDAHLKTCAFNSETIFSF